MHNANNKKLRRQIELSEHKRINLLKIFTQPTMEEDFYLWSLVDLMTLLLIFFILFYSRAVSEKVSDLDNSTRNQAGLQTEKPFAYQDRIESVSSSDFSRPAGVNHLIDNHKILKSDPSLEQLRLDILSAIDNIEHPDFSVRVDQRQLILTLGECITFYVGKADLLKDFQPTIKRIAHFIASKEGYRVLVSGHTDNTPINTPDFPSNWELSAARSVNVAKFLIKNGVDSQRVSIQGFAEHRPLFENNSPRKKQANRRVEITLIKEQDNVADISSPSLLVFPCIQAPA